MNNCTWHVYITMGGDIHGYTCRDNGRKVGSIWINRGVLINGDWTWDAKNSDGKLKTGFTHQHDAQRWVQSGHGKVE